jgi:hypothetical protein
MRPQGHATGAIEGIALPRLWRYLDAMPVNAQSKITLSALLALLESTGAANTSPPTAAHGDRTLQLTAQHVQLSLQVPADLLYFNGHFPALPSCPGWCRPIGHWPGPPPFRIAATVLGPAG